MSTHRYTTVRITAVGFAEWELRIDGNVVLTLHGDPDAGIEGSNAVGLIERALEQFGEHHQAEPDRGTPEIRPATGQNNIGK